MLRFARRLAAFSALVLLTGAGCVATPLPNPPTLDPPSADRILHVEEMVGTMLEPALEAPDGALEPGTTLFLANLESTDRPLLLPVDAGGALPRVQLFVRPGDELRLQARRDDERSAPIDAVVVAVDQPLGPSARPLAGCLTLEPALELLVDPTAPTTAELTIANACAAAVQITPRLRIGGGDFTLDATAPVDVAAGGEGTITVRYAPGTSLPEDILLLDVTGAGTERRPITLLAR